MSKCQKNKYAAGGKCGSMSNSAGSLLQPSVSGAERGSNPEQVGGKPLATFGEINGNFAALLASREKQDALLFSNTHAPKQPKAVVTQQAIVPVKKAYKSDIDTVLEGDF